MTIEQRSKLQNLAQDIDSLQFVNADTSWDVLWRTLGHTYKQIDAVLKGELNG